MNGMPEHWKDLHEDNLQASPMHHNEFRMRGYILEHINEAVGAIDNEGRITYINAAAERLYQVRAADVIGRHYTEVYTRRWSSPDAEAHALDDLHEFGHSRWELDHITHDGRVISVEVGVALYRDDWGNPVGTIAAIRDMSERKRVEKQLQENQHFTRRVLDNLFAFVGVMTTDGTLIEANRAPLDAAGIAASDVIGKKFWDCYWWNYSADTQNKLRLWCERAARGEIVRSDVPVRMAGDKQMWIDFQLAPLRNEEGNITHLIPSAMDISARIEMESALRAREEQLRQNAQLFSRIVDQAPTGMYVIDSDFRFHQVNALAAPVFSSIEPLIGRDFNEIMEILWGPEVGAFVASKFRHTLDTGERYVSPSFMYDRYDTGEEQAYDWETQRVILADGKYGVVCYFHDVTQREKSARALRESDERFRMLADHIPQMAWMADPGSDGQVHWFNRNWFEYTGTTLEEMRGLGWHKVHHPDFAKQVIAKFTHHVQHGLDWEDTFPIRGKDGQYRWFLSRTKCIRDASGTVVRIFGTNTDISTERQMAEDMQLLSGKLSDADRRKDEFLATLAHELRNPLAPVSNAIQVMRLAKESETESSELLDIMERQVSHLTRLVDDLMEVSRISSGKIELRKTEVELPAILQTAIEICQPRIDENQHRLNVHVPTESIVLNGDQVRLSQVVANLLTNAAKYTNPGGQISLIAAMSADQVTITVSDNGLGIPPSMLNHVFEMFIQTEHTRRHTHGGLGIGLALAKNLVEMHGGKIEAFSQGIGQGSQFVVTLPILKVQNKLPKNSVTPKAKRPLPKRKVFVVDDMKMARVTLEKLLTLMDQEVRTFPNAQSAIECAIEHQPHVIISDIGMPDIDGYELARRIRGLEPLKDVILVALTGYGQLSDRQLAANAGFDRHLTKPVNGDELRSLLHSLQD